MFLSLASRLVSAVGSLLGKRNPEEVHDPLEPEKKKKKQDGKKSFEKDGIKSEMLDFLSSYVGEDKTKREVEDLSDKEIKKLAIEHPEIKNWIEEIEKAPIPPTWKTDIEHCKVKKAFLVTINALGITLGDTHSIPLFDNSAHIDQIENLLSDFASGEIDFFQYL